MTDPEIYQSKEERIDRIGLLRSQVEQKRQSERMDLIQKEGLLPTFFATLNLVLKEEIKHAPDTDPGEEETPAETEQVSETEAKKPPKPETKEKLENLMGIVAVSQEGVKRREKILSSVDETIKRRVKGRSSMDWAEKVFVSAGFIDAKRDRQTMFDSTSKYKGKESGEHHLKIEEMEMLVPGDWLFVNDYEEGPRGNRSVIFLGWKDKEKRIANIAFSPGTGSHEDAKPGKKTTIDFTESKITRVIRVGKGWEKEKELKNLDSREKILKVMKEVIKSGVRGDNCWNWIEKIYLIAGLPQSKRRILFSSLLDYPEGQRNCGEHHLDPSKVGGMLKPGDWIFINNKNTLDRRGNHSIIFQGWIDKENLIAKTASCHGKGQRGQEERCDFKKNPIVLVMKPV